MAQRDYPLFIIDNSRSHGRGREKDFVVCTSRELPWVGEITILNERELEIDQDWQKKNWWCIYTDDNGAGLRGKLKVVSTPAVIDNSNRGDLQALMRRCLKEWRIRRGTVAVDLEDVSKRGGSEVCRHAVRADPREPAREPEGPAGVYGGLHPDKD